MTGARRERAQHSPLSPRERGAGGGEGEADPSHSHPPQPAPGTPEQIHLALLSGLLVNIGFRDERDYQGARGSRFQIHPSSGLFKESPKWIVAAERIETSRSYGRIVARVQPAWIERAGAHLLQRGYFEPHWQRDPGQVAAFERVTLFGVTLVPKRRVNYGPINPAEAREVFIRFALVEGDFETRAPFWRHNRELIEYVQHLEAKSRRRDILVDEEAIYAFYAQRIPEGIYSRAQLEKWLRALSGQDPKRLHMRMSDLMRHDAAAVTAEAFPDALHIGATPLPLEYHFDPGERSDGVTLVVPLPLINQVTPERLEWLVPGLIEERIVALMRALPKHLRKQLVPLPDTAGRVAASLKASDRPLIEALGEAIRALTGVHVPEDAWDASAIPDHLRMKVRLVDELGRTIAAGPDPVALKRAHGGEASARFASIPASNLEREGLTRWDFDELPETVELERGGIRIRGYPALVEEGERVALRVLDSQPAAASAMRAGLRRLIALQLPAEMRYLRKNLPGLDRMRLQYAKAPKPGVGAVPDLADELVALILDLTFVEGRADLRSRAAFEARLAECKGRLMETANTVCALVGRLLTAYQSLRGQLAGITQINWLDSVRDIQSQLDRLVFRGFLMDVPYAHLEHYPRYLNAAQVRAERLTHAGSRDRDRMREMAPLVERLRERARAAKEQDRRDPRLEEIGWMLEELRVSFFAQQLGTAYPVSVKRIEARWKALGL